MVLIYRVHEIIVGIRPLVILLVTFIICEICGTIAAKSDKSGEIVVFKTIIGRGGSVLKYKTYIPLIVLLALFLMPTTPYPKIGILVPWY